MRKMLLSLVGITAIVSATAAWGAPPNPFRGRSPVLVAEQRIAVARTALDRQDGDAAALAIKDAIEMGERFQERRPSTKLVARLDACLKDVADDKLLNVVKRAEGLREELAAYAVYRDTGVALAAVNEAADAAARGQQAPAVAAIVAAKTAVRIEAIDEALVAGRAELGIAYEAAVSGKYRRAAKALDDAQAALQRAEHNVVLAEALVHVRHAEAATGASDFRTASGHAAKASGILTAARSHVDRETERVVYEAVDGLNSIAERAKQQNPNIWEEIPPLIEKLDQLLNR